MTYVTRISSAVFFRPSFSLWLLHPNSYHCHVDFSEGQRSSVKGVESRANWRRKVDGIDTAALDIENKITLPSPFNQIKHSSIPHGSWKIVLRRPTPSQIKIVKSRQITRFGIAFSSWSERGAPYCSTLRENIKRQITTMETRTTPHTKNNIQLRLRR